MAKVSVLLPSLRPEAVSRVVREFLETNASADYEIVVVSPFKVASEKVVHLLEEERRGVLFAMNRAYKAASGSYIVTWSDDAFPGKDCLTEIVAFVESQEAPFLGCFQKRDSRGREAEQWAVYGRLYASWFCASRKTLDMMGGLWDPGFKNYWADPDLSLRVYAAGGRIAVCPAAPIRVQQLVDQVKAENLRSSFEADTRLFFERWHDKLARGAPRVWTDINVPIPCSFGGRMRALLRKVPFLRRIKNYVRASRSSQ